MYLGAMAGGQCCFPTGPARYFPPIGVALAFPSDIELEAGSSALQLFSACSIPCFVTAMCVMCVLGEEIIMVRPAGQLHLDSMDSEETV